VRHVVVLEQVGGDTFQVAVLHVDHTQFLHGVEQVGWPLSHKTFHEPLTVLRVNFRAGRGGAIGLDVIKPWVLASTPTEDEPPTIKNREHYLNSWIWYITFFILFQVPKENWNPRGYLLFLIIRDSVADVGDTGADAEADAVDTMEERGLVSINKNCQVILWNVNWLRLPILGLELRDSDLHEIIASLDDPDDVVKANTAAYIQQLSYQSDPLKQQMRLLGGIPPLVALMSSEQLDVHRNACGALR
jgi:Armadillo/beta-catenin-like repeat